MPMGRPKVALLFTDDERQQLESLAHRSRTMPQLARRARIVLACADGHDNTTVAKRLAPVAHDGVQMARALCPRASRRAV